MKLSLFNRRSLAIIYENVQCAVIGLVLTPSYYTFHMTIIREGLTRLYSPGPIKYWTHIFLSTFCFINVIGNMFLAIFTDTSVKNIRRSRRMIKNGTYCEHCEEFQPPKSWHCEKCNMCIVNRNHHCFFIARCVGQYNQRYYLLFMLYILISLLYSTFYDFFYILSKFENWESFAISVFQFFNPLVRAAMGKNEFDAHDLYGLFLLLNTVLIIWVVGAVWYHWGNAMEGVTPHERSCRDKKRRNKASIETSIDVNIEMSVGRPDWKKNLLRIFGTKWYLAILIPVAHSPIPDFDDDCDLEKTA